MKLHDKVAAVIDSDLSQYEIAKITGISQSKISRLRHGEDDIDDIALKTAQRLADVYDAAIIDLVAQGNDDLRDFKVILGTTLSELLQSQQDIIADGNENDAKIYPVIEQLFQQTLDDNERIAQLIAYYGK